MSSASAGRPDYSMTLITEMMQRPLDPGYAAAASSRQESGLPPATGRRSPLLVIVAVLIGALLGISALSLRAPAAATNTVKLNLVGQIEAGRTHSDAQSRLIADLRNEINTAQAAALGRQREGALAADLARLELAAGTAPLTGPGLVLTIDDAETKSGPADPIADPRNSTEPDDGKVLALDLQIIVNGLWAAGAEAISVNGHRLTSRAAIRFAGEAILVDYRPLTRPYVVTAIGDPGSLGVEFADNSGGSHLQSLKTNYKIRNNIANRKSVVVPSAPALSLQKARTTASAVTKPGANAATTPAGTTSPGTTSSTSRQSARTPQTTETSP